MMFWMWISVRIVANPISNVFQKKLMQRAVDPILVIGVTHCLLTLACLPILLLQPLPTVWVFWWNISICTILNIVGNTLLVKAVQLSDLSVLGPINAYKPVLSLLPGFLLLGEVPHVLGIVGIALILVGSLFLADVPGSGLGAFRRLAKDRGVQFRFGAMVATALEAVFLKKAVLETSAWTTFAYWSLLGFVLAAIVAATITKAARRWQQFIAVRTGLPIFLWLGVTTGLMQLSTIIILDQFQVGYSLALFQTSAILSVILGHRIFQEPHLVRRLLGSTIMVGGAAMIILGKP